VKNAAVENRVLVAALERDLDRGEAEAIALACEVGASLVLLDEREGRRTALRLGLRCAGVVGVLLEAKERGMVEAVRPLLDALRDTTGFYLTAEVYRHALVLAGEDSTSAPT
jgi:predicted nucleic acid-binding protein